MKRVFSLFLAVLLVFGSIPTSFAHAETAKPAATGDVKIGDIPVGGTFTVGMWPQHLVEDASLLAALDGQECNMFSYGFGYGSNNTVGGKVIEGGLSYPKLAGLVDMRYGDIVYAGTKYRKVVVNTMLLMTTIPHLPAPTILSGNRLSGRYWKYSLPKVPAENRGWSPLPKMCWHLITPILKMPMCMPLHAWLTK